MATKIETYTFLVSGVFSENAPRKTRALDTNYPVIQMDVIDNYTITLPNRISNYAIESRSNISDHIFSENIKLQFTARIGHAFPMYVLEKNSLIKFDNQNTIKANKPQQAYELIKKLRDDKLAFDVLTEQELFEGMVITDLSIAREAGDDQLVFNISLEKFRKVEIGRTVLSNISTNTGDAKKDAKGKELKNKTANKTSEGSKTSGNTASVEKQGNTIIRYYPNEESAASARAEYSKEIAEGKLKIVINSGRNISEESMSQLSVNYVLSNLDETKPYQAFRATLEDNTYEFTFQWNTRGKFWTCAIGAVGDTPVIKYKITANSDPLIVYGYSEDLPQGYLNVISLMNTRNRVAIDSIGQEKLHQFIYFTPVD